METRYEAKTRHTSVETEPRSRNEKPRLETVSRQDTCLETPSLAIGHLLGAPYLANVNSRSRSLYAVACPSVFCLSVVCNVRAPYSGGSNFRQYFYGVTYLGHPLTSTENFMAIVQGEPPAGGVKHKRGSKIAISDLSTAISRKRCKIEGKLVLITNRKSYFDWYQNR